MTALSYKLDFFFQVFGRLLLITVFYFMVKALGGSAAAPQGYAGGLFPYVLVGIAFSDCISVSMSIFGRQIREGQTTGSLEITLLSPVPLPLILVCSSLWAYFFSGLRLLFYLLMGALLFGVGFSRADWAAALAVLVLTDLCFMGLGILFASVVVLFKRGDSLGMILGDAMVLVGGALFPVAVLPHWVQLVSKAVPFMYALECMRGALLEGRGLAELGHGVSVLVAFALVCLGLGLFCFDRAVGLAKRQGSLAEF